MMAITRLMDVEAHFGADPLQVRVKKWVEPIQAAWCRTGARRSAGARPWHLAVAVVRDCPERGNGCATSLFFTPPKRCWTERGASRPCENAAKVQMDKMESSLNITYSVNTNLS
jgi:hypothetical protein